MATGLSPRAPQRRQGAQKVLPCPRLELPPLEPTCLAWAGVLLRRSHAVRGHRFGVNVLGGRPPTWPTHPRARGRVGVVFVCLHRINVRHIPPPSAQPPPRAPSHTDLYADYHAQKGQVVTPKHPGGGRAAGSAPALARPRKRGRKTRHQAAALAPSSALFPGLDSLFDNFDGDWTNQREDESAPPSTNFAPPPRHRPTRWRNVFKHASTFRFPLQPH